MVDELIMKKEGRKIMRVTTCLLLSSALNIFLGDLTKGNKMMMKC